MRKHFNLVICAYIVIGLLFATAIFIQEVSAEIVTSQTTNSTSCTVTGTNVFQEIVSQDATVTAVTINVDWDTFGQPIGNLLTLGGVNSSLTSETGNFKTFTLDSSVHIGATTTVLNIDVGGNGTSTLFGSEDDVYGNPNSVTEGTDISSTCSENLDDLYFVFHGEGGVQPNISLVLPPLDASSTMPVFEAFDVSFSDMVVGSDYSFIARFGTNASTVDDFDDRTDFGWDNWVLVNRTFRTFIAEKGNVLLETSFNEDFVVDQSPSGGLDTYYVKVFLFDNVEEIKSASTTIATTTLISFQFNNDEPILNLPPDQPIIIPIGSEGFTGDDACILCNTFPFAYMYDIQDIVDTLGTSTNSFPSLSLDFSSTTIPFTVSVYSSSSLLVFFGSSNWDIVQFMVIAFLWFAMLLHIFHVTRKLIHKPS